MASIDLTYCEHCHLISNPRFDPEVMRYQPTYDNSLFYSDFYRAYSLEIAQGLAGRYNLRHACVVDIGCGQGDFLDLMRVCGDNRCIGFEPCFGADPDSIPDRPGIDVLPTEFSASNLPAVPDIICSRYVLEHVQNPLSLLKAVHQSCLRHEHTVVFFEVPNMEYVLKECSVWDIIYEHCNYFNAGSLAHTFRSAGLQVYRTTATYGSQFLTIEAGLCERDDAFDEHDHPEATRHYRALIETFSEAAPRRIEQWNDRVLGRAGSGENVALWGSGAKGVMLLNLLRDPGAVSVVVDVNPNKRGAYVPGTGHRIVSVEELVEARPDVVFVANPLYIDEIGSQLAQSGCKADLETAQW